MTDEFNIRSLNSSDWQALRDIRLESLQENPGVYSSSYDVEKDYTEQEWCTYLENSKHRIFATFRDRQAIAIQGVFTDCNDASGKTATLGMWYLNKSYRGRGLFSMLTQAAIDWTKTQARFDRIIVGHREGNEDSRCINQRAGFSLTGYENHVWGNGDTAKIYLYEMRLT